MQSKPKIVFVSGHSCVRCHKEGLPLLEAGYNVHLIARKYVPFNNLYRTWCRYDDIGQCIESIKLHGDADIFHVHNEPSWFVCAIKEAFPDKPVVLDVHDSFLTRSTPEEDDKAREKGLPHLRISTEERNAFQLADSLVFVSDEVKDTVMGEFGLNQPHIVLPSYVPSSYYQYHTKEWLGGLVYEGRVTTPDEHEKLNLNTGADYCDYTGLTKEAKELGLDFHLYAGRDEEKVKKAYEGAFIHQGYEYRNLLKQVSRHDWGLVGNTIDSPQWQATLPNKLYDYVAAGTPVVCLNARSSSKEVEQYGVGITVGSLKELTERWSEHRGCRLNVWKNRKQMSMEAHIDRLLGLYGDIV